VPSVLLVVALVVFTLPLIIFAINSRDLSKKAKIARQSLDYWSELDIECDRHYRLSAEAYMAGRFAEAKWHEQIYERLRHEADSAYDIYKNHRDAI
jgi:predicted Holliday junction resolvase-like endonuclease